MEIHAKIALNLPNIFYKITLIYNTFEKATFDSYLIASLVKNTSSSIRAGKYINEITGKGSLNPHFKKLYKEISGFTDEQIDGILNDSLYPVVIIDEKNHFKYYPMFDATRMNNNVFDGNLADDEELLKSLIMPKGDNVKFQSIEFKEEDGTVKSNVYDALFSEDKILIDLDNKHYKEISKEDFKKVYVNDVDITKYSGQVKNIITQGNWNVLNNTVLDNLLNQKQTYINNEGNHCIVLSDCLKVTEVVETLSLYFYKETRYEYSIKNEDICEEVVDYLFKTKAINEFRTKSLISLLMAVSDKTAQKVVQYLLGRKDSKDIATVGLKLIKSGQEKGWEHDVLLAIKKLVDSTDYKYLYKIDNNLNFNVEDLLLIDDVDLAEADKIKKKAFIEKRKNMIDEIGKMLSEITMSGVRERMKKLKTKDKTNYQPLNLFIREEMAHLDKSYESMSTEKIKNQYNKVLAIYYGPFKKILEQIKKFEEEN